MDRGHQGGTLTLMLGTVDCGHLSTGGGAAPTGTFSSTPQGTLASSPSSKVLRMDFLATVGGPEREQVVFLICLDVP